MALVTKGHGKCLAMIKVGPWKINWIANAWEYCHRNFVDSTQFK